MPYPRGPHGEFLLIDKDVPIPTDRREAVRYPWADMMVGDSIKAPFSTGYLITAANHYTKYHHLNWRFRAREEGDGARIWRIK